MAPNAQQQMPERLSYTESGEKNPQKYILSCFDGKPCNFTGFERDIGLQVADIESWIANTFYHLLLVRRKLHFQSGL